MGFDWLYLAVLAFSITAYVVHRERRKAAHEAELAQAVEQGLNEPASLHPVVNPARCIGSGGCATACPEGALGIVRGKAVLINASACIGHGACAAACPVEAIQLVLGTERRGIDIPYLTPDFQTNVPGIFVAGELGGMGLIRKAAEQGRQAMESVRRRSNGQHELDVVIVGCGPAGLSAGLSALQHRQRFRLIEQEDSLGGTIYHYPRQKVAMTAPVKLALVGRMNFGEVRKETLLEYWQGVVEKTRLPIHFRERLEDIEPLADGFRVRTSRGSYTTRSVLLTMGRRGTPRKLGVPGEESAKVVYRLIDADQYAGQSVLVVGGGDSALEAAMDLASQGSITATLCYRGEAFSRVKPANRERLKRLQGEGRLRVLLQTEVQSIDPSQVHLVVAGQPQTLPNDAVIVCAGGELPTGMLRRIGVRVETRHGEA